MEYSFECRSFGGFNGIRHRRVTVCMRRRSGRHFVLRFSGKNGVNFS